MASPEAEAESAVPAPRTSHAALLAGHPAALAYTTPHSEPRALTASAAEAGEVPRCCSRGWPAMWMVVLLDTLAGVLTMIIFPDLGTAYFGGGKDPCINGGKGTLACDAAVSQFSSISAAFGLASAVLSFVCGPVAGAAADAVGTKPILVLSILVKVVSAMALMGVSWAGASIYYLFFSSELAALVPTRLTFGLWVLENTPPAGRSQVYARLTAALTIEGIIAPLASVFNQRTGPVAVMAITLTALGSSILFLQKGRPGSMAREELPGSVKNIAARLQLRAAARLFTDPSCSMVTILVLIVGTCADGVVSIWFFFLKEKFGTDMNTLGPVILVITLSNVACQMFLVGPLERLMGLRGVVLLAFTAGVLSSIGYIIVPSVQWLYLLAIFDGLSTLANPITTALLTNVASRAGGGRDVGVTLGVVQSVTSVTGIIGPLFYKMVFSFFLQPGRHFVGAIWVVSMLLEASGLALALRLPKAGFVPTHS